MRKNNSFKKIIMKYKSILFLLTIGFSHCAGVKTIDFKYEIHLPYRYFKVISESEKKITPESSPWEETKNQIFIEKTILYLFDDDENLEKSYLYLFEGNIQKAIELLENKLKDIKDTDTRAKYLNNAAVAYFFDNKGKNARNFLNQAGLLLENDYILHNLRVLTNTLSTNFSLIK